MMTNGASIIAKRLPISHWRVSYQVQAMAGLVEDGVWERETLLNAIWYLVWQHHEGEAGLAVERMLLALLER